MTHSAQPGLPFGPAPDQRVDAARLRSFAPSDARREAHHAVMVKKQRMYTRILQWAAKVDNFTADELAAEWGVAHNSVAPRCTELLQLGKLVATGKRRKTRAGKSAAVLEVNDALRKLH